MKRIVITNGTYGHRPTGTYVEPKQAGDPPFSVADAEADRLIGMGIARLADPVAAPTAAETSGASTGTAPEYSDKMKLTELKEIAAAYGVDPSSMKSKKEVIEAIEASKAAPAAEETEPDGDVEPEDEVVDDGEDAPELSAADPVN